MGGADRARRGPGSRPGPATGRAGGAGAAPRRGRRRRRRAGGRGRRGRPRPRPPPLRRRRGSSAIVASSSAASGSASSRTVATAAPLRPSIRQWWALVTSAQRPPARPSSSVVSQSGRERSSRCEKKSPSQSISSASPPGAGSVARRISSPTSRSGSSTHSGSESVPTRGEERRRVKRGSATSRSAGCARAAPPASGALAARQRLEDHRPADVHVGGLVRFLELEEGGVQRRSAAFPSAPPLSDGRPHDDLDACAPAHAGKPAPPLPRTTEPRRAPRRPRPGRRRWRRRSAAAVRG